MQRNEDNSVCTIMVIGDEDSGQSELIQSVSGKNSGALKPGDERNIKLEVNDKEVEAKVINGFIRISSGMVAVAKDFKVDAFVVTVDMGQDKIDMKSNLRNWIKDIERDSPGIPVVVIGMNNDKVNRQVDEGVVKGILSDLGVNYPFYKTSEESKDLAKKAEESTYFATKAFTEVVANKLAMDTLNKDSLVATIRECIEKGNFVKSEGKKDILNITKHPTKSSEQKLAEIQNIATNKHKSSSNLPSLLFSHTDDKLNELYRILKNTNSSQEKATELRATFLPPPTQKASVRNTGKTER